MVIVVINALFSMLYLLLIVRVIWSWVDRDPFSQSPVKRLVWATTEPLLAPLRRFIPPLGMVDITPLVAFVLLEILQRAINGFLAP
jgi:YggT family protein